MRAIPYQRKLAYSDFVIFAVRSDAGVIETSHYIEDFGNWRKREGPMCVKME